MHFVLCDVPGKNAVVLCCKTRVTYTHTQVSRGGIVKVASECCGAESTHSKLRLRLPGKHGVDFDFNLFQKTVFKSGKMKKGSVIIFYVVLQIYSAKV